MLAATSAGYLYWDNAQHFETTNDAFIVARQFAITPGCRATITAVPVTDNQHVAAGAVIARIDDRNYHIALAQAEAQTAARENRRSGSSGCRRRGSRRRSSRWVDLTWSGFSSVDGELRMKERFFRSGRPVVTSSAQPSPNR